MAATVTTRLTATLLSLAAGAFAPAARASVDVTILGNTAQAHISLTDAALHTYDADVSIAFDTPQNLTAANLGLTAELVDPNDSTLQDRLDQPLLDCSLLPLSPVLCLLLDPLIHTGGVQVDPNFPMLITVEPPDNLWLFHGDFESGSSGDGNLHFLNYYEFELHAIGPAYADGTTFRLYKAPVGGAFADQTSEVLNGSVRARGRSGGFSQFILVRDTRSTQIVALQKTLNLELRTLNSSLGATLQGDLIGLLSDVLTLLLNPLNLLNPNYAAAIAKIDQFDAEVAANAGAGVANEWRAQRDLSNDSGDLQGSGASLKFSLQRGQDGY
jgi:hypothetical protein